MKVLIRFGLYIAVALLVTSGVQAARGDKADRYSEAQRFALRMDAILDTMTVPTPAQVTPLSLWVKETAPYLQYEGIAPDGFKAPRVVAVYQSDGMKHNHVLGWTQCDQTVFINRRVLNPISAWYGVGRNPVATLIHEMIHTAGGDFCSMFDTAKQESSTQTATLEVLAALANGGNTTALYTLISELKETAMDTALADALAQKDPRALDRYRAFRRVVNPSALEEARFEKSMRTWAKRRAELRELLRKYSVIVYSNVRAGKFRLRLPSDTALDWVENSDTLVLDDLAYVMTHAEEMARGGGRA